MIPLKVTRNARTHLYIANVALTKFLSLKMNTMTQRSGDIVTIMKQVTNITCYLTSIFKNEDDLETQSRHWKLKLSAPYCRDVTHECCLVIDLIVLEKIYFLSFNLGIIKSDMDALLFRKYFSYIQSQLTS